MEDNDRWKMKLTRLRKNLLFNCHLGESNGDSREEIQINLIDLFDGINT